MAVPTLLVFFQPDLGTALVFVAILAGIGLMAGATAVGAVLWLAGIGLVNALVWYGRLHYRLLQPALEPQTVGVAQ